MKDDHMKEEGAASPDHRLPASCRMKKRGEFLKVQNTGKKAHTQNFVVSCMPGIASAKTMRLGITVSKRVDKRAVVRNLLKRRVREVFRTQRPLLKGYYDVVVIARQSATEIGFQDIRKELLKAFKKLGILEPNS